MGDLSDWMWLLVAVVWIALRLLPRLFGTASARPAPSRRGRRQADAERTGTEILSGDEQPPPIVPR